MHVCQGQARPLVRANSRRYLHVSTDPNANARSSSIMHTKLAYLQMLLRFLLLLLLVVLLVLHTRYSYSCSRSSYCSSYCHSSYTFVLIILRLAALPPLLALLPRPCYNGLISNCCGCYPDLLAPILLTQPKLRLTTAHSPLCFRRQIRRADPRREAQTFVLPLDRINSQPQCCIARF